MLPLCTATLPPHHPAPETLAALAAVVGGLVDAGWGGSKPLPRAGPNPAVEAEDVEGVLGAGVTPFLRGEAKPPVAAAGGVL